MGKFVGRQRELAELNAVLAQGGAQFILVYGRRRVGKTTLVLHWAEQTGQPIIYWVATRDTPPRFARASLRSCGPGHTLEARQHRVSTPGPPS